MKVLKINLIFLSLVIFLSSCVYHPMESPGYEPQVKKLVGSYTHEISGVNFPEKIGGFERGRLVQYSKNGDNISVGYNYSSPLKYIAVTVYVYPMNAKAVGDESLELVRDQIFNSYFEQAKLDIQRAYSDVQELSDTTLIINNKKGPRQGRAANFNYRDSRNYAMLNDSYLYMFRKDDNLIKYRITHVKGVLAKGAIQEFMENFGF